MARKSLVNAPPLLLLGRLDGRLRNSPAADLWIARARVGAASRLAGLAGVPVSPRNITDWICGRTPPPRHSEGLDDPMSVAALFHFVLLAHEEAPDPIARATLNVLRTLLDDRGAAEMWGGEDLVRFGAAFRDARAQLAAAYPAPTLLALAERILETHQAVDGGSRPGRTITAIDGRQLAIDAKGYDSIWLLGCQLPGAFAAAGLTSRALPSLVGLPRFLPSTAEMLADQLEAMVASCAAEGLAELDALERIVAALPHELRVTSRSKAPLLLRLELAYPGLRPSAVARLLGVTHQGAAKLIRLVEPHVRRNTVRLSTHG